MNIKKPLMPCDKYMLTIKESAEYFGIGSKKLRRMAEDNEGSFSVYMGNRYLIIRPRFEEYLIGMAEKGVLSDAESDS